MKHYKIKLSFPVLKCRSVMAETAVFCIRTNEEIKMVYGAVDWYEDNIFSRHCADLSRRCVQKRQRLRAIVNIHNKNGIRDLEQILRLKESIKNGKNILTEAGMPNIKILKTKNNKLFLFDGHHSMLAYMANGIKHLDNIPHLLIEKINNGKRDDDDICHFFGGLLPEKMKKNWQDYTVNWQAPKTKQLCIRKQKNMGELFDALSYTLA